MQEVEQSGNLPIPTHLQDAHYKGAAKLGHGTGYKYAHDYPNHYVEQQYLPYELSGREFYCPSGNGYEHMKRIRREAAEKGGAQGS
jgi:putative ATPase